MTFGSGGGILAATALVAAPLVGLVAHLAPRLGWLDVPVARSAHCTPVPRVGGLGLVGAVVAAAMVLPAWWTPAQWAALGLVALVGFLDDLWNLPATPRLLTHVVAAVLLTSGLPGETSWLWRLAAVVWVTGFTNAFNFMDGIDGIAGLQSVVAALACMTLGVVAGEPRLLVGGAVLAGASLGFLFFNWSPARVFMGDVGATFMGAALASMPWVAPDPARWILPAVVVLAPFWADAGLTLLKRVLRGEVLYQGHQEHFYQRLVNAGLRHATVAAGYGVMTAIGGGAAVVLTAVDGMRAPRATALVLLTAVSLMALCAGALRLAARLGRGRPPVFARPRGTAASAGAADPITESPRPLA